MAKRFKSPWVFSQRPLWLARGPFAVFAAEKANEFCGVFEHENAVRLALDRRHAPDVIAYFARLFAFSNARAPPRGAFGITAEELAGGLEWLCRI
jgi:hypothetical protein